MLLLKCNNMYSSGRLRRHGSARLGSRMLQHTHGESHVPTLVIDNSVEDLQLYKRQLVEVSAKVGFQWLKGSSCSQRLASWCNPPQQVHFLSEPVWLVTFVNSSHFLPYVSISCPLGFLLCQTFWYTCTRYWRLLIVLLPVSYSRHVLTCGVWDTCGEWWKLKIPLQKLQHSNVLLL